MRRRKIQVLEAPYSFGQPHPGVAQAPQFFRKYGLQQRLGQLLGTSVHWANVGTRSQDTSHILSDLAGETEISAMENDHTVILGGDHSIALGSICGLLRTHPDLHVIWIDAHADMNTPLSSSTGNLHGMPLGGLLGLFSALDQLRYPWLDQQLDFDRLYLVGGRDFDPAEIAFIEEYGIRTLPMKDLRTRGFEQGLEPLREYLSDRYGNPFHISFDIDAVDPRDASATGLLIPDGLRRDEILRLASVFQDEAQVVSTDLVEFDPLMAKSPVDRVRSFELGMDFLEELFYPRWSMDEEGSKVGHRPKALGQAVSR